MAQNENVVYAKQYTNTVMPLLQQEGTRFMKAVTQKWDCQGELVQFENQVDTLEAQEVTGRGEPIQYQNPTLDARWVTPQRFDIAVLLTKGDTIKMVCDLERPYVARGVAGMGRRIDTSIVNAFHGTAKTGKDGGDTESFSSDQLIAADFEAAADVGMTAAKLLEGIRLFEEADADLDREEIWCALSAKQNANLRKEVHIYSKDYNYPAVFDAKGRLLQWMGVNFIHSERLKKVSNNRECPMWLKSGMGIGFWMGDWYSDIDKAKWLKEHPTQIYLYGIFKPTRLQKKKVLKILAKE